VCVRVCLNLLAYLCVSLHVMHADMFKCFVCIINIISLAAIYHPDHTQPAAVYSCISLCVNLYVLPADK